MNNATRTCRAQVRGGIADARALGATSVPSVVISWRVGTKQQSAGRTSAVMASIHRSPPLEIHVRLQQAAQCAHVMILDVTAVLA